MGENETDASSSGESKSTAFDKLETADDHEDRAERLRAEAKRDVLDKVSENVPFDAKITVELKGGAFIVNCSPKDLTTSLENEFDENVDLSSPIRFTIGEMKMGQKERAKAIKKLVSETEEEFDEGAPLDVVLDRAEAFGLDETKAEMEIGNLKQKGEVYEPSTGHLRTT